MEFLRQIKIEPELNAKDKDLIIIIKNKLLIFNDKISP
jgi:hypothetical protein